MRFFNCSLLALPAFLFTALTATASNAAPSSGGTHPWLGGSRHGTRVHMSRVDARSRIAIAINEAAHSWSTKQICGPREYWQITPESANDSKAQEFFQDWMKEFRSGAYSQQCLAAGYTAIQCFAGMWWGDFDFGCTINQIERCSVPTACSIATWIQGQHPDWPAHQVVDTARKVYYSYKHFQLIISDLKTDWDVIGRMGTVIALEAHSTVNDFTPQHNPVALANCRMVQQTIEMAIDAALQGAVVGLNTAMPAGELRKITAAADDLMKKALETPADTAAMKEAVRAAQKITVLRNSVYYTQWLTGHMRKGQQIAKDISYAHYNAKGTGIPERESGAPRLEFPSVRGHGFCGNVFGVMDDNALSQADQVMGFVSDHMSEVRRLVEQLFNSFFIKDQEDLGDKALEEIMDFEVWSTQSARSYDGVEKPIAGSVRNSMLSELMAASRQYIKCEERDDAAELCEQDKDLKPKKRQGIVCPPKYPRLRCKAGRWTKKQIFNSEKQLSGLEGADKFAGIGIDFADMVSNSVDRFYTMGTDSYSPRIMFAEGHMIDPAKLAHLPVAISKVKTVHPGHTIVDFPFSCGDWKSNCTTAFLDRINVNIKDEPELRAGPLINHINQIPEPANRFLLLCTLGVSWPHSRETMPGLVGFEPSIICGEVKKAIEDKDEFEGNYQFCNLEMVRKHAFEHERSFVLGSMKSHKAVCEKWFFDNSLEIDRRFG